MYHKLWKGAKATLLFVASYLASLCLAQRLGADGDTSPWLGLTVGFAVAIGCVVVVHRRNSRRTPDEEALVAHTP